MNRPINDRIVAAYVHNDTTDLDSLYTPDAVADVNVPQWRYQLRGAGAITAALRDDELGAPDRQVSWWRTGDCEGGLFLELEAHVNDGEHRMWRSLHLFRITGDRISEHTLYCSGIWSPADIARYEAQAPVAVQSSGSSALPVATP